MATHSSILAWIIPLAEESGRQGVEKRHDKVINSFTTFTTEIDKKCVFWENNC